MDKQVLTAPVPLRVFLAAIRAYGAHNVKVL